MTGKRTALQAFDGGKDRQAYSVVYHIQCITANIARRFANDHRTAIAMDLEAFIADPNSAPALCSFRARPGSRSDAAINLRHQVADFIRRTRQS